MPVRMIPCRHTETGAEVDIPETALRYDLMPTYEPINDADRERIDAAKAADKAAAEKAAADAQADTGTPTADPPPAPDAGDTTSSSKPATGAAKKK